MHSTSKITKKIFAGSNIKSIENYDFSFIRKYKIVVFVPLKNTDELTFALASAGAGTIGNYTVCSFRTAGAGTFLGDDNSNPSAGKKNNFEITEEIRLEMICDKENLNKAIDKIYEVHPYEEPAYEIYEVLVRSGAGNNNIIHVKLKNKISVHTIFKKLNHSINPEVLPSKLRNRKVKQAVIDCTGNDSVKIGNLKRGTLYLKKNKKLINIEII